MRSLRAPERLDRSNIIQAITAAIDEQGLTVTDAAARCGTAQSTLSHAMHDDLKSVTIECLLNWLVGLTGDIEISVSNFATGASTAVPILALPPHHHESATPARRGRGIALRDPTRFRADFEQPRELLATWIASHLMSRGLSVRAAQRLTGFTPADFSRIRGGKLKSFTFGRMVRIATGLGYTFKFRVCQEQKADTG
jgi:predicted XRE-type DNA-binding protein